MSYRLGATLGENHREWPIVVDGDAAMIVESVSSSIMAIMGCGAYYSRPAVVPEVPPEWYATEGIALVGAIHGMLDGALAIGAIVSMRRGKQSDAVVTRAIAWAAMRGIASHDSITNVLVFKRDGFALVIDELAFTPWSKRP